VVAFTPMVVLRSLIGDKVVVVLGFALFSALWTSIVVFLTGVNKYERNSMIMFAKSKLKKPR
jgi:hypothetical protein